MVACRGCGTSSEVFLSNSAQRRKTAMRSLISIRTNPNDLGNRQDRRVVGLMNELRTALRASFSFFRHAAEALAGYQAMFKCLLPAVLVTAAAVPTAQHATCMSRTLGSFGPQGRFGRQGRFGLQRGWHSKHGVRHASARKG